MAILNITLDRRSGDVPVEVESGLSDDDIRRIAVEVIRSGEVVGIHVADLDARTFEYFVVDRMIDPDGTSRMYLRPKVPFGADR